jgi:hypothetical protein
MCDKKFKRIAMSGRGGYEVQEEIVRAELSSFSRLLYSIQKFIIAPFLIATSSVVGLGVGMCNCSDPPPF